MTHIAQIPSVEPQARELPDRIVIPPIRGEMVHLRPATVEDLPQLDALDAFYNASSITGKDRSAERALVHTWVRRSVAWMEGRSPDESGVGDPESRRTIAWSVLADCDHDGDGTPDGAGADHVIGMVFLIDIDAWARSARIQVVLGKDYRGRGYSRDAMPRVMTFGFAPMPAGLGMHRIWVGVPEKNTRSISVYQSLGFQPSGTARDGLWDVENAKYQDLIVMDTLVDEYDPIRSLDAFGMHVLEDNPGVKEALSMREHSMAIRQRSQAAPDGAVADADVRSQSQAKSSSADERDDASVQADEHNDKSGQAQRDTEEGSAPNEVAGAGGHVGGGEQEMNWPYNDSQRAASKEAWWRTLGRGRKRDVEDDKA